MFFGFGAVFLSKNHVFLVIFDAIFGASPPRKYPILSGTFVFNAKTQFLSLKISNSGLFFAFREFFRFPNFAKKRPSPPRKCPQGCKIDESIMVKILSSFFRFSDSPKNIISSLARKCFKSQHTLFLLGLEEGGGGAGFFFLL